MNYIDYAPSLIASINSASLKKKIENKNNVLIIIVVIVTTNDSFRQN